VLLEPAARVASRAAPALAAARGLVEARARAEPVGRPVGLERVALERVEGAALQVAAELPVVAARPAPEVEEPA
jgi:hypothetical protein